MIRTGWLAHTLLLMIAISMGTIALRPYVHPQAALAFTGKFDYVNVISPMFLYKGTQGVLLMDMRNGNVWFISRGDAMNPTYKDPVFVVRLPLDKLDQAPQSQ